MSGYRERPILFSDAMVRALLTGTKTQTRRGVKLKNGQYMPPSERADPNGWAQTLRLCPYGRPGDRLWVREAFAKIDGQTHPWIETDYRATYKHGDRLGDTLGIKKRWLPSIHMPRHASRITLEVTGVRFERLQAISHEDAKSEGAWGPDESVVGKVAEYFGVDVFKANPRLAFQMLWESINGADSWAGNPHVWVVEFRRLQPQ